MIIDNEMLFAHGAKVEEYKRGECIFSEGTVPKYYYQILEGTVKISTLHNDGKEFVHGYPFEGHCFGESYLFTDKNYAINAFAERNCSIVKLEKAKVLLIFDRDKQILNSVIRYTADRLHFRYIISSFLPVTDPVVKVEILFSYLKLYFMKDESSGFVIPYTRKQIAGLTGLRLETVVRVIKRMENSGILKIIDKKINF
ncbi:Crp/Fnr family transcriptional regulator [Chryseobacterium sp. Leaf394]|uniref:Crp/Fnr family transcriptional regulator n=1 Tax=Chryseobacterium sp. Leaf394 TaxID=1736361 RepID=UPI0006F2DCB6|nr:Crp/Fnr family transcriptional regulator [Chryseobacterium sp. Leaf394]KQS91623.1 hypothetical protein ASG21_03915 [Chryseobacterium sp. Leaf394]